MSANGNNIPAAPQQLSNNNAEKTRWYTEAGKYLNNIEKLRNNVAKGSVSINNAMTKATTMSSRVDNDVKVYRKQLLNSVQSELRSMNIVPNNKVSEYSNLIRRIQRAKIAHLYRKDGKIRAKHPMTSWDSLNKKILKLLKDNKNNIRAGMAAAAELFKAGFFVRARELMSKVTSDADKALKNKLNKLKARVADPNGNANAKPANANANAKPEMSRSDAMVPKRNATANENKELEDLVIKANEKVALNRNKASNNNTNGQGIQNIFNGKFNNMSTGVNNAVARAVNPIASNEEAGSNGMLANAAAGAAAAAQTAEANGATNAVINEAAAAGAAAGVQATTPAQAAQAGMSVATSNPAFNSSATGEGTVLPSNSNSNNNQGNE